MERMVADRLTYYLEYNKGLTNVQTAFRKNRCTVDQIIKLQDEINRNIHTKRHTCGVFIDFERAFDMLWRKGVLIKLKRLNISGNIYNWLQDFLQNRTCQVRVGNAVSTVRAPENGTPQCSPLSPLLFLIAINDLPDGLEKVEKSLFADDTAIYKSGTNRTIRRTMKVIQESLDKIEAWCNKWGFKISTSKTI